MTAGTSPDPGAGDDDLDVAVVGGGAVGLYLGTELLRRGVRCRVFEQQAEIREHSRAIGIHPPGLAVLEGIGVSDQLITEGTEVRGGVAMGARRQRLGRLDFGGLPAPFPFALTCPQHVTERVLRSALVAADSQALCTGYRVVGLDTDPHGVELQCDDGSRVHTVRAKYVIGADGHASTIRTLAGFGWSGGRYPHRFVMGDYEDVTGFASDAVLFLHRSGLTESFPLPGGLRRWVATLPDDSAVDHRQALEALVAERAGVTLSEIPHVMVSDFTIQHGLADRFVLERVVLVGDAAHVVSPIGGQGMNLGWLDAHALAPLLEQAVTSGASDDAALRSWERNRRRSARIAIARAERNLRFGLGGWWNPLRDVVIRTVLRTPLANPIARVFTMQDL
jgi:2-polyprenyl-6-methoxyphenol hydroxylase-like FAD-dependent oxidoreductase